MLIIQTAQARRFRKYAIMMAILFVLGASFWALLMMHWYVSRQTE